MCSKATRKAKNYLLSENGETATTVCTKDYPHDCHHNTIQQPEAGGGGGGDH